MEDIGTGQNGSVTNEKSTTSTESLIDPLKLQQWQENSSFSSTGVREGQINLVIYGRQCGKSMLQLEYMKQIGKRIKDQRDQSETD